MATVVIITGRNRIRAARNGRSVIYALYDNHVAMLLDEAVYHIEHLGLGVPDEPSVTA